MPPSMNEPDEKPNHKKISKSWNFERKWCKVKDSFLKSFHNTIMFNCSKCLTLDVGHMCKK
jgi:hypothetical protein